MSTPDRKKVIDFSYPFWIGPFKLLVPKPEEESRLFAFIRPFQPLVFNSINTRLLELYWFKLIDSPRRGLDVPGIGIYCYGRSLKPL